jgi:rhodanese-related sulfurtransferase
MEEMMATEINAQELKQKMDNKEDFILIEVLLPELYEQWHIPGAINIPADDMKDIAPGKLSKEKEIIFYCRSLTCGASDRAADALEEMGYENVIIFRGGKKEWEEKGYLMQV